MRRARWVPWFFMLSGFILFSAEAKKPRRGQPAAQCPANRVPAVIKYAPFVVAALLTLVLERRTSIVPHPTGLGCQILRQSPPRRPCIPRTPGPKDRVGSWVSCLIRASCHPCIPRPPGPKGRGGHWVSRLAHPAYRLGVPPCIGWGSLEVKQCCVSDPFWAPVGTLVATAGSADCAVTQ